MMIFFIDFATMVTVIFCSPKIEFHSRFVVCERIVENFMGIYPLINIHRVSKSVTCFGVHPAELAKKPMNESMTCEAE